MGLNNREDPPASSSHSSNALDKAPSSSHSSNTLNEGASSSHSPKTPDEAPPPYSENTEPGCQSHPRIRRNRALQIYDSDYALPGGTINPYAKVAVALTPQLSTDPEGLYKAIRRQIKLPPRPLLGIHGWHTETYYGKGKKEKVNYVTDFFCELDLAETMLTGWEDGRQVSNWMVVKINTDEDLEKAYRGGFLRSRTYKARKRRGASLDEASDAAISHCGADEPDNGIPGSQVLRLWCERFCHDPAPVKSFTLHRKLRGFDFNAMRNVLSSHIRELNYCGAIHIKLSLAQKSVTIYSPHWINRLRTNSYVWWIIVLLQLWIITWPIIFFMEKRYEIAFTCWNASSVSNTGSQLAKVYPFNRDESTLAKYWAPAVKHAAWTRRHGGLLTRLDADRWEGCTTRKMTGVMVPSAWGQNRSLVDLDERSRDP
ncbi:hypothetical protein N7535_007425 [Penicillium sp. DV-2018c]|nr:hypothetical protein N7535_007425 [Penicillium sp. DV-2018c]